MLALQAALWREQDALPLHLIVGMLKTKDAAGFLSYLLPFAQHCTTLAIPEESSSFPAAELARIAVQLGHHATPAESLISALRTVPAKARVLICGSLYLAGHVLAEHGEGL